MSDSPAAPFADRESVLKLTIGRAAPVRCEPVAVPGLAAPVYVRELSIGEVERMLAIQGGNAAASNTALIVMSACTADGRRLFFDDDLGKVQQLPASVGLAIATAASKLNRYDDATVEAEAGN